MADEVNDDLVGADLEAPDAPAAVNWWEAEGVSAPCICNVSDIGEFMSASVADYSPLEPGVWLIPAQAYQCEPPEPKEGFAALRSKDGGAWEFVADYRGKTVYSTADGHAEQVTALGELTTQWTLTPPSSEHDEWDNGEWVPNEEAIEAERQALAAKKKSLLTQLSSSSIATLEYAVDLDMATDAEVASLKAWKVYQVLLSRLPAAPTAEQWPASPMSDSALAIWLKAQGYADTTAAAV